MRELGSTSISRWPTAISQVRGAQAAPFYAWVNLEKQWQPKWNFHKVLIGREGRIAGTFGSDEEPDGPALSRAIETAGTGGVHFGAVQSAWTGAGYRATKGSTVRSVMPSISDCAIRSRSQGVFVKGWRTVNRRRVLPEDRQLLVAIVHQSPPQQPWVDAEVLPPEAALDRDLPQAGDTEHEDIVFLFQENASLRG